jgi:hypothetical protein
MEEPSRTDRIVLHPRKRNRGPFFWCLVRSCVSPAYFWLCGSLPPQGVHPEQPSHRSPDSNVWGNWHSCWHVLRRQVEQRRQRYSRENSEINNGTAPKSGRTNGGCGGCHPSGRRAYSQRRKSGCRNAGSTRCSMSQRWFLPTRRSEHPLARGLNLHTRRRTSPLRRARAFLEKDEPFRERSHQLFDSLPLMARRA